MSDGNGPKTKIKMDQSTLADTEVAGNVDLSMNKSTGKNLKLGEPRTFLGLPIKIWIGASGAGGLLTIIGWLVYRWAFGASPPPG